jgi:hypothetical protein
MITQPERWVPGSPKRLGFSHRTETSWVNLLRHSESESRYPKTLIPSWRYWRLRRKYLRVSVAPRRAPEEPAVRGLRTRPEARRGHGDPRETALPRPGPHPQDGCGGAPSRPAHGGAWRGATESKRHFHRLWQPHPVMTTWRFKNFGLGLTNG